MTAGHRPRPTGVDSHSPIAIGPTGESPPDYPTLSGEPDEGNHSGWNFQYLRSVESFTQQHLPVRMFVAVAHEPVWGRSELRAYFEHWKIAPSIEDRYTSHHADWWRAMCGLARVLESAP